MKNRRKIKGIHVHVFTKLLISQLVIAKEYQTWYQINDY